MTLTRLTVIAVPRAAFKQHLDERFRDEKQAELTIVEGIEEVRELLGRTGIDPAREPEQVRRLVDEVVADYDAWVLTSG